MYQVNLFPEPLFTMFVTRTSAGEYSPQQTKQWWGLVTKGDEGLAQALEKGLTTGPVGNRVELPFIGRREKEFYFDGSHVSPALLRASHFSLLLGLPANR